MEPNTLYQPQSPQPDQAPRPAFPPQPGTPVSPVGVSASGSGSGGGGSRKMQRILMIALGVAVLVIIILLSILLVGGDKATETQPQLEVNSQQGPGATPSKIEIENMNNAISHDLSTINDGEELPKDTFSDKTLGL